MEEELEKGRTSPLFNLWQVETDAVEERYGYWVEHQLAAVTAPRVKKSRSSVEAHRLFHERSEELAEQRWFFEIRLPDRFHNLRTLIRSMGGAAIWAKALETERHYQYYARRHGILVPELHDVIDQAYELSASCMEQEQKRA